MKRLFANVLVAQADPGGAPLGRPALCSWTSGRAAVIYVGSGGVAHAWAGGGRSNGPAFIRDLSNLWAKGGWAEDSKVLPGSILL